MKRQHLIKATVSIVLSAALLAGCCVSLIACNRDKQVKFTDVFKNQSSYAAFTKAQEEFTLPAGWEVYTSSSTSASAAADVNSDVGYIKELDGFVVVDPQKHLSIIKCGVNKPYFDGYYNGMIFRADSGISALRVKNGLIVAKFDNGQAGVFDYEGRPVISRYKIGGIINGENASKAIPATTNIDKAIKILDGGLIAVHANHCQNGKLGYSSIYRINQSGNVSDRGELVCRVKNDGNNLDYVLGFDSKYVSVVGNSKKSYMFAIPQTANGNPQNLDGSGNGTVSDNGKSNYYSEITYIGGGRFFVHQDWTVTSSDAYTYYDADNKYYVVSRHIYYPDSDSMVEYTSNSDKMFLRLTNKYYDKNKNGIDTNSYLNDGFMYAAYGVFIDKDANGNNVGYYDQYILDYNLNIVMSLSSNFGIKISGQKKDTVGYFDLIMTGTDGYYYVPYLPSDVAIYDSTGKRVGHNKQYTIVSQNLQNGVLIAQSTDKDDSSKSAYGAFDLNGNVLIDFKYSSLTAFRGFYALGQRKNEDGVTTNYLIDRNGDEVETLSDFSDAFDDIAKSTAGLSMYKIGCYMFKQTVDGQTRFGLKNFDANADKNVLIEARMQAGSVLYSPAYSQSDVFVFSKSTAEDQTVTYTVYRII